MDAFELLGEKVDRAIALGAGAGVSAVLKHLQIAERHFDEARRTGEDELFTDVIYRANQVYEGMLREGCAVFAGAGAKKRLKTHGIRNNWGRTTVYPGIIGDVPRFAQSGGWADGESPTLEKGGRSRMFSVLTPTRRNLLLRVFKTLCQPEFTAPCERLTVPRNESPVVTV